MKPSGTPASFMTACSQLLIVSTVAALNGRRGTRNRRSCDGPVRCSSVLARYACKCRTGQRDACASESLSTSLRLLPPGFSFGERTSKDTELSVNRILWRETRSKSLGRACMASASVITVRWHSCVGFRAPVSPQLSMCSSTTTGSHMES